MLSSTQPWVRALLFSLLIVGVVGARAVSLSHPPDDQDTVTRELATDVRIVPAAYRESTPLAERAPAPRSDAAEEPAAISADGDDATTLYRICRVTAYCDQGKTAAGLPSGVGQCAAPEYIPLGARVYIPDLDRTLIVTDRTHKRFRQSTVDIFIPDKQACLDFGCNYLECEITIDPPEVRAKRLGFRD